MGAHYISLRKGALLVVLMACVLDLQAQPKPAWERRLPGEGIGIDYPVAMDTDTMGNMVVAVVSRGEPPGLLVVMLAPNGDTIWSSRYRDTEGDAFPSAIDIDDRGGVAVTGCVMGRSGVGWDFVTISLTSTGTMRWIRRFDGAGEGDDRADDVAVDPSGTVFVTGSSHGIGTGSDIVTVAYGPEGDTLWISRYDSPSARSEEATALAVAPTGDIYVAGSVEGDSSGVDYLLLKYDPAGSLVWASGYDGGEGSQDRPIGLALDHSGNITIAGTSHYASGDIDLSTVGFDRDGNRRWADRYDGGAGADEAAAMAVDSAGNIIVAGRSMSSAEGYDYLTVKYGGSGERLWARRFHGGGAAGDGSPPLFSGLSSARSLSARSVRLTWGVAIDDQTSSDAILYDIYRSTRPTIGISDPPAYTVAQGRRWLDITGLSSDSTYYFVVRARDHAGNRDDNSRQHAVRPSVALLIAGAADDTALFRIPDIPFPDERPGEILLVDGVPVSTAHLLVVPAPGATVGEVNALIESIDGTIDGSLPAAGLLLLRVPSSPDMQRLFAALDTLRASRIIAAAAPNFAGEISIATPAPSSSSGSFKQWKWHEEAQGNWAHRASRIPQAWNLVDLVRRGATVPIELGIVDIGFAPANEDYPTGLVIEQGNPARPNPVAQDPDDEEDPRLHGTQVTGMAAARWGNAIGIDGTNPLPDAVRALPVRARAVRGRLEARYQIFWGQVMADVYDLLDRYDNMRVVNVSLGMHWRKLKLNGTNRLGINPVKDRVSGPNPITWGAWMDQLGDAWRLSDRNFAATRSSYLIVVGAGNESTSYDTRYNSPCSNVAIRFPELHLLNVEATTRSDAPKLAAFSEHDHGKTGASVSAGGEDVLLLSKTSGKYMLGSGTSFASPFVAGLASYLWKLDPNLSFTQIKSLLRSDATSRTVAANGSLPDGAPMVDAFAAATGIDLLRGNQRLQRALVDVDDGTVDGNLRTKALGDDPDPDRIHTPDGRRGDGRIDMSDLRAFRDAFLLAMTALPEPYIEAGRVELDGPETHFKRDLNYDGCSGTEKVSPDHPGGEMTKAQACPEVPSEHSFSRYDFNGNGSLDPHGDKIKPPASALAPFGIDPDTECTGLDQPAGSVRDLDPLADASLFDETIEHVLVDGAADAGPAAAPGNNQWSATLLLADRNADGIVDYLRSADLHIEFLDGGLDHLNLYAPRPDVALFAKGIRAPGVGTSVVTVPVFDTLDRSISIQYMIGSANESRIFTLTASGVRYGEDFVLRAGDGVLELKSVSRGATPFLGERQSLRWNAHKDPFAIRSGDEATVRKQLEEIADGMADGSELATWLGGRVKVQAYNISMTPDPPESTTNWRGMLMGMVIVGK